MQLRASVVPAAACQNQRDFHILKAQAQRVGVGKQVLCFSAAGMPRQRFRGQGRRREAELLGCGRARACSRCHCCSKQGGGNAAVLPLPMCTARMPPGPKPAHPVTLTGFEPMMSPPSDTSAAAAEMSQPVASVAAAAAVGEKPMSTRLATHIDRL